jgi:hypothetical protein
MLQLSTASCRSIYANVSHGPLSVQDFHTIIYFLFSDAVISDRTVANEEIATLCKIKRK